MSTPAHLVFAPTHRLYFVRFVEPHTGAVLWCAGLPATSLHVTGPTIQDCLQSLSARVPVFTDEVILFGRN